MVKQVTPIEEKKPIRKPRLDELKPIEPVITTKGLSGISNTIYCLTTVIIIINIVNWIIPLIALSGI